MSEEIKETIIEDEEDEGISLFDFLIVLAKYKKLIILFTLPVAIITGILTLSSYSFYRAQTTILPPLLQKIRLPEEIMNRYSFVPGIPFNTRSNQELTAIIIKSRTFSNRIIERFNLIDYYEVENMDEARTMFLGNLDIEPDFTLDNPFTFNEKHSPLTKIFFIDQDAERSANIVNAVVDELQVFFNNIATSEASHRRRFFEEQLNHVNQDLISSEEKIKLFQEKTGMLTVETQTRMVIEKIATLQAQVTAKEVELEVMKSYSTASNPDFQRTEETIRILKKELAKLEANESNDKNMLIPTGTIPELGLEYKRKFRELKFNETLYEIMLKQYEVAKIDEAKKAVFIHAIDKALPPESKNKMRTFGRKKALTTTSLAFFFSYILAFALELHERSLKNRRHSKRIETLKRHLSFRKKI
jgi:capsule polysaccharide export protein KpsE/RkpR